MNTTKTSRTRTSTRILAGSIAALLSVQSAQAANQVWDGDTSALWSLGTNWVGNPLDAAVPGTGETATFNGLGNGNTTIDLGGGVTIGQITFDTLNAAAYTIGSGGAGAQTLTFSTNNSGVTVQNTVVNNQLINANIVLDNANGNKAFNFVNNDTAQSLTFAGGITSTTTGTKTLNLNTNSGNAIISGNITNGSGTVNLVKQGAGLLTLSGANTFNNLNLNSNSGTVRLGSATALQGNTSVTINIGSTLDLNGNNASIGNIYFASGAGTSTLTTGVGTLTVTGVGAANSAAIGGDFSNTTRVISGKLNLAPAVGTTIGFNNGSGTMTVSADISGQTIDLRSGTILFSGVNTNAGTTLTGGVFQIGVGNVGSVGAITSSALGTGTLTIAGGTVSSDGVTARTVLNAVTFTGNGGAGSATNTGKVTFAAAMNLNGGARTFTVNSDVDIDGDISGAAGSALLKNGAGLLTINGTGKTLASTGNVGSNGGILRFTANNQFTNNPSISVGGASTATTDLNGTNQTAGALFFNEGTGNANATLTTGVGTLTVTGTNNINGNHIGGSVGMNFLKFINGNLSLGGGTRQLNNAVNGYTAELGLMTVSAVISSGGLTIAGSSAPILFQGANTYAGGTTLSNTDATNGSLRIGIDSVGSVGAITSGALGTGTLTFNGGNLSSNGATARTILNSVLFTNGAILGHATNSGKLTFADAANLNGSTRTITVNSVAQFDGSFSNGGITKAGTATLILNADNSGATGGTTISAGAIQFNAVNTIPGTTRNVTVTGPGAAMFGPSFETGTDIPTALLTRIVASSTGAIATDNYAATDFDFAAPGLTAASLGAVGNVTYTGTTNALTPNGITYRLGGGGGTLTFTPVAGTFDNTRNLTLFGNGNVGTVDFGGLSKTFGTITFSGGTTQNGTLTADPGFTFAGGTVTATLVGAGPHSATGNTTLNAVNTISGNINVTANTLTAINPGSLGTATVVLNGGNLALTHDGTGTGLGKSNLENVTYGNAVTVAANQSITVGRVTNGVGTLNAANKTMQLGTLSIGAQTLTATNSNGYGLEFTGTTTLTGATASIFSVGTASVSTAVHGLTLNGLTSDVTTSSANGATILTKNGVGTLVLKGSSPTFGGNGGATGQIINITDGYLAADSDAALGATGATGNVVQINTNNATKGFLATETFSTDRVFRLNNTNNAIDAAQGKTLTLTTPFTFSNAGNDWQKNDVGTVEINADNSGLDATSNVVVAQGSVRVSHANALGAAGNTSNGFTQVGGNVPAAIQLNGVSIGEYFKIGSYGTQNEGALVAVGGTSTITGTLDTTLGDSSFGAASGATLNVNGTFPVGTTVLNIAAVGTVNVNSTMNTTTGGVNVFGPGAVNFTTSGAPVYNRAFNVRAGATVTLAGTTAFKTTAGGSPSVTFDINGSTVVIDNSTNAVANRFGGATANDPVLGRSTLTFTGGGTVGEAFRNLTIRSGLSTLNTSGADAGNILNFNSQSTRDIGGVVNVNSTGSSSVRFTSAPGLTDSILKGWFVGDEFATHGGNNTAVVAYAAYTGGDLGALASNGAQNLKPSGAQTTLAAAKTFNAMNLTGSTGSTIAPGIILTVDSGSLINSGTGNISGGTIFSNNTEWVAKYSGSSAINSVITGNAGFTKLGAGNLTLGAASTYVNTTTINEGTLTLAGGNNTLAVNAAMVLNGGTLALGSNNQYVGNLTSNTTAALGYGGSGGNVTGTGTLTTNGANGTFAGNIGSDGGALNFVKAGSTTLVLTNPNATTGTVSVIGGELSLRDSGSLASAGAITINGGTLRLDNGNAVNASKDVADRLSGSAITMNGGTLIYQGRIGYNSTESVGAVTANTGANVINAAAGGTGVNSAQLTLVSLTRATGAEIEINRQQGNSGLIGNNPRVVVTAALTGNLAPVNGVVPGVFGSTNTDNYHFVGYAPGLGFGNVGAAGFPTTTSNFAAAGATDNVQDPAAGTAVVGANKTINSLRQANLIFTNGTTTGGTDLLTIGSGMAIVQNPNDTWGTAAARGRVTSGTQELFIMHRDGNATPDPIIHSVLTDNGNPVSAIFHTPRQDRGFYIWLTAANTYSGGTYVNGGSQAFGNSLGGISLNATTPGTVVIPAGGLTINSNGLVDMSNNAGQIDSLNVVTINGGGQLNLMGTNTLAGIVFNSNGGNNVPTVGLYATIGTPPNNGQASRSGTGTLILNGNVSSTPTNVAVTPVIGPANSILNLNDAARDFTVAALPAFAAGTGLQVNSIISSTTANLGAVNKLGAGVLELTAANTFTGGLNITAGAVRATTSAQSIGGTTNVVTLNGATAALWMGTNVGSATNLLAVGASGGTLASIGDTRLVLMPVSLTGALTVSLADPTLNSTDRQVTIDTAITGGGSLIVTGNVNNMSVPGSHNSTATFLSLGNAGNNYSGGTTINSGGRIRMSGSGLLGSTSGALTINTGGTLDLNNTSQAVGNFTGTGGMVLNNSGGTLRTLTIGTGNGTGGNYAGTIANNTTGTGTVALTKTGTGTITLSGTNTYTGVTTASGGVLRLETSTSALPGGILTSGGTSNLTFNGGVIGLGSNNSSFTRSLNTAATATAVTFTGAGGFAAYGADATVNLGGGGTVTWGTADTGFNGQTVILGASDSTHMATVSNDLDLGTAGRTIQVDNGSAADDGRLAGAITGTFVSNIGDSGGLTKTGDGSLRLDGDQSYKYLTANAGTTNVNGALTTLTAEVAVNNSGTKLRFGTVSQTLGSLTIGAGATVVFTSGLASGSLTGDDGGGKAVGFGGGATVPEPGTLGLLLVGALGLLKRRRRQA
jgi:autotransporter-associated beta strand protein